MNNENDSTAEPAAAPQWLIHTCPHCDGKFKVSADSAETEMACPHCNEAVALLEDAGDERPQASAVAPYAASDDQSSPIPTGLKSAEDFASRHPDHRRWDASKEAAPAEKKHARSNSSKKKNAIDWDEEKPAEDEDDGYSTYYIEDPDNPDSVRIKRTKRKKRSTKAQKLYRYGLTGAIALGVITATGVIIATVFFKQAELATTTKELQQQQQPEKDVDAMIASGEIIPPNTTKDEIARCMDILDRFINAKTVEERLSLVRTPERVRPMLEAIHPAHGLPLEKAKEVILDKKIIDKERHFINLAVSETTVAELKADSTYFASFQQLGKDILLDWEVTAQYQKMPYDDFITKRPKEPVPFRVKVERSDLLVAPYDDPDKYESVLLTYPGKPEFRMIGFFDKESDWGVQFNAKLEFEAPSVYADIRLVDRIPEPFVEVTRVMADTWFLD